MPTNDGQYMYYKKNTHAPTVTVFTFAAHLTVHRCAQQYRLKTVTVGAWVLFCYTCIVPH